MCPHVLTADMMPVQVAAHVGVAVEEVDIVNVSFEELIGLRGPWRQLFKNAATFLAKTFVFLLAMLWLPVMLGSFTLVAITRTKSSPPFPSLPPPSLLRTPLVSGNVRVLKQVLVRHLSRAGPWGVGVSGRGVPGAGLGSVHGHLGAGLLAHHPAGGRPSPRFPSTDST